MIGNQGLSCSPRIRLRYGWYVHLQQAAKLQEALARCWIGRIGWIEGGTPLWRSGKGAGEPWILFRLQLRRQAVDCEVVRDDVISEARAAANRPFPVATRIPGETESRHEVVGVRLRCTEDQSKSGIV